MTEEYWVELGQHPEGALFYSPHKQEGTKHPEWVQLKLMRPAIPGRRIKRRVWLSWNSEKQELAHNELADQLPEIYSWVWDTMDQIAERLLEQYEQERAARELAK